MRRFFLWLSPILLVVELIWLFWLRGRWTKPKKEKHGWVVLDKLFGFPIFVVALPLFIFLCTLRVAQGDVNPVLTAAYDTLCRFVVEGDFTETREMLKDAWAWSAGGLAVMRWYLAFLYILAPVTTFTALLSLFNDPSNWLRLHVLDGRREKHIFSELNENSLALANSILEENKTAAIVFCDVYPDREERGSELIQRASELGARCFRRDITALHLSPRQRRQKKTFYLLGADERENVEQALILLKDYSREKSPDCGELFLFSTDPNAELLIKTDGEGSVLKTRLINDAQRLVYRMLYTEGDILFTDAEDGEVSVAIVGMGRYGTELAKALLWFCQMPRRKAENDWVSYTLKLDCFSLEKDSEARFAGRCPEIIAKNNNKLAGEARYSLRFHEKIDVATEAFFKKICECEPKHVFVCLGEDAINIRTAVELRRRFERLGQKPRIMTTVYSSNATRALAGQDMGIDFLGDLRGGLTIDLLFDKDLEGATKKIQLDYLKSCGVSEEERETKAEEDLRNEYNYRSSASRALYEHVRGKLYPYEKLPDEPRRKYEHCRWNAWMRTEGHIYAPTRNRLGKTHPDLVNFYKLPKEERMKD